MEDPRLIDTLINKLSELCTAKGKKDYIVWILKQLKYNNAKALGNLLDDMITYHKGMIYNGNLSEAVEIIDQIRTLLPAIIESESSNVQTETEASIIQTEFVEEQNDAIPITEVHIETVDWESKFNQIKQSFDALQQNFNDTVINKDYEIEARERSILDKTSEIDQLKLLNLKLEDHLHNLQEEQEVSRSRVVSDESETVVESVAEAVDNTQSDIEYEELTALEKKEYKIMLKDKTIGKLAKKPKNKGIVHSEPYIKLVARINSLREQIRRNNKNGVYDPIREAKMYHALKEKRALLLD